MPWRNNNIVPENEELASIIEYQARSSSALSNDADHSDAPRIEQSEIDENDFKSYAIHTLQLENAYVHQLDIEHPPIRPKSIWEKTIEIPRWLLLLSSNAFIIILIFTFCVVFIYKLSIVGYGQSCLYNSNCNSYVGLICTAGTCSCSTVQFWDGVRCTPQRTYNRSCTLQSQCNSLANLLCMNVTIGLYTDSYCWCSIYRYWNGNQCVTLKSINQTCSSNSQCDFNNFLKCINGICNCNSSQFWNNEYCENKRLYGVQCFSTYWCNNVTAGLACSTWAPTTGTCACLSNQYWWSTNNTCLSQLSINTTCSYTYQCLTNQSLSCSTNSTPASCQCSDKYWYNTTKCTPKFSLNASCTDSLQCDSTVLLICDLTTQMCTCNETYYIWDGTQCVIRRTIGGACASNDQCLAYQNLTCPTSGVWNYTCACPTNYYWSTTISSCVLKILWNETCTSSYECYDGGYLSCQVNATVNTSVCDCANDTYYWTGFQNNTYSGYCTSKLGYGIPCVSNYECQDYNFLSCITSQCQCSNGSVWNSGTQQCNSTTG